MNNDLQVLWERLATLPAPSIIFVVGVGIAVLVRGFGLLLLVLGSWILRGITRMRLSALLEELTLYKFFERRPAVMIARSIEIQLQAGILLILFCVTWALRYSTTLPTIAEPLVALLQVLVSMCIGWLLVDLYRLVSPISRFRRYETATRDRIRRMKQRLETEQADAQEMDEKIRRMSALADEAAFEDEPFFAEEAPQSTPDSSTQTEAREEPPNVHRFEQTDARETAPEPPSDTTPHPEVTPAHARTRAHRPDDTVYQSAWMSGTIRRWPEGAPYGFIVADTGEQFFAGADNLAGLEPLEEGDVVLFQPVADTPHRRAALVCGIASYGQGRVNGIRGNMGFITIQDSRRSASIYFRLPVGMVPEFKIGDTVGFRFGRNILGPTAEKIDTDLGDRAAQQRRI